MPSFTIPKAPRFQSQDRLSSHKGQATGNVKETSNDKPLDRVSPAVAARLQARQDRVAAALNLPKVKPSQLSKEKTARKTAAQQVKATVPLKKLQLPIREEEEPILDTRSLATPEIQDAGKLEPPSRIPGYAGAPRKATSTEAKRKVAFAPTHTVVYGALARYERTSCITYRSEDDRRGFIDGWATWGRKPWRPLGR